MPFRAPGADPLEQVHELNRVFLTFLQTCARDELDCLGLPDAARRRLRSAGTTELDSIAEFPRALFEVRVAAPSAVPLQRYSTERIESLRQSMNLTILLCAWTFSRQSVYHARFLLALDSAAIQRLRALQLTDLQRLAFAPDVVSCAFATREWLWIELLTETRAEARRQLALVALQPGLERDWPARRTVQAS
jgi:hypothetical protein